MKPKIYEDTPLNRFYCKFFEALHTFFPNPDNLEESKESAEFYKKKYEELFGNKESK